MPPIRVLNVITRLEQGGAPLALLDVLGRMRRDRFDIHLAAGKAEDPTLDIVPPGGGWPVPFHAVPTMRRSLHPARDLASLVSLVRIIRRGRFDIVHTHTSKAGILGRLAAIACGVPVVIHSPHGTVLEGYFGRATSRLFATAERLAALGTDCIISLTSREVAQYVEAGIARGRQHVVIGNGIDIQAFDRCLAFPGTDRTALGLSPEHIVCITVGRLVPVKGYDQLLEAFAIARRDEPRLRLLVVGEGEMAAPLRDRASHPDLQGSVVFTGWRRDVPSLLGQADLFLLSSLNEGFGLVLVEAMVAGLPVVATSVGGVPHVVKDGLTGLLVPARDPPAMAYAILRYCGDAALRRSAGKAGRCRAVREFSISRTVRRTEDLYESLYLKAS